VRIRHRPRFGSRVQLALTSDLAGEIEGGPVATHPHGHHTGAAHLGEHLHRPGTRRFGNARGEGRPVYRRAMPTPVTGSCNLHTADCYGHPLGVRCRACERRVLVPLDRIGAQKGGMTLLQSLPLKCTACVRTLLVRVRGA
jgi:hypothetical protein